MNEYTTFRRSCAVPNAYFILIGPHHCSVAEWEIQQRWNIKRDTKVPAANLVIILNSLFR